MAATQAVILGYHLGLWDSQTDSYQFLIKTETLSRGEKRVRRQERWPYSLHLHLLG